RSSIHSLSRNTSSNYINLDRILKKPRLDSKNFCSMKNFFS
ncbi:unnamed protein product, partial [Larinioides sclopetarius]